MMGVEVTPVKVRDLPRFLKAIEPIAAELAQGDLTGALIRQADAVIEATAIGAGVDRAWLDEQTPDALFELAAKVLEVNGPFLTGPSLPHLIESVIRLLSQTVSGGSGSSSASPEPGSITSASST